jgi:hypothetical protein
MFLGLSSVLDRQGPLYPTESRYLQQAHRRSIGLLPLIARRSTAPRKIVLRSRSPLLRAAARLPQLILLRSDNEVH